jgi:hypothetical protein
MLRGEIVPADAARRDRARAPGAQGSQVDRLLELFDDLVYEV